MHPLGPSGIASLNHSNGQIRNIVRDEYRSSKLPDPLAPLWADVRDVALAHVEAALRLHSSGPPSNGRYATCSPEWAEEVLPPREGIPPFKNISLDGTPATRDLGVNIEALESAP